MATKIVEAKPATAKTVKVTFDGPVDTTTSTAIKLTRGTTDVTVKAEYADDKKSVVLTSDTTLAAGSYSVTVGTFDAVSFTVEKQTPNKLVISSKTVANKNFARIYFQVLDQYDDIMTNYGSNKITMTAFNSTKGHSVNPRQATSSDNFWYVDCPTQDGGVATNNVLGDSINVVAYVTDMPQISTTATLTLAKIYVDTLEFGDEKLGDDKRVTVSSTYELPYTAKDNEGNSANFETGDINTTTRTTSYVQIGDYSFVSSNPAALPMNGIKIDSKGKLTFTTGNTAGTAVITALNTVTGTTTTKTIVVNALPVLAQVDIAEASVAKDHASSATISAASKFSAAVTAYDQFGEVIAPTALKGVSLSTYFSATDSNSLGAPIEAVRFSADGKYIEYNVKSSLANYKGTAKFTMLSKTNGATGPITSKSDVVIGDEIEPASIEAVKAPGATFISGDKIKLQFAVKDQYQNRLALNTPSALDVTPNGEYWVKVESTTGTIVGNSTGSAVAGQWNVYEVESGLKFDSTVASVSKTDTINYVLMQGNKEISSLTYNITVAKEVSSFEVSTDKDTYSAGDKIVVTVKAMSQANTQQNSYLNGDVNVIVCQTESALKTFNKTLKFKDGEATFDLTAEAAGENREISVTKFNSTVTGNNSTNKYKVLAGSAGTMVVSGGQFVFKDAKGNFLDAGSGSYESYATFTLKNVTRNNAAVSISDLHIGTGSTSAAAILAQGQTAKVEINNASNTVTKIAGIDYDISGTSADETDSFAVSGIKDVDVANGDVLELSVTINGLTWSKKIVYTTGDALFSK
ncbi:MAG: hypothetical protein MRZ65_11075 [Lachnospiraceae bacterium]|nr:hypothetical protein [Lachnospiraceae bacterium]